MMWGWGWNSFQEGTRVDGDEKVEVLALEED